MSKFYFFFFKLWEIGAIFTGDQTFLLATKFFKIHGALIIIIIEGNVNRDENLYQQKEKKKFISAIDKQLYNLK